MGKRKTKSKLERKDVKAENFFPIGHGTLGNSDQAKLHRFRKPKFISNLSQSPITFNLRFVN